MTSFENLSGGRTFEDVRDEYDTHGYVIFPSVLADEEIARQRAALEPWLQGDLRGRNDFEGLRSNRVYAMLAKDPVFADLVLHPLVLGFAERILGESLLLSACLAINLLPGETPQPWHSDDSHLNVPRPRSAFGVSTFWALDECTAINGATELVPGSHLWDDEFDGAVGDRDFQNKIGADVDDADADPGARPDAIQAVMPAGSLMVAQGTLWHRGGANRSDSPRLIVTPQYCPGWARQLENMVLAVPPDKAALLPERAQQLLGYGIHPPFMGYVDGRHPNRVIPAHTS